MMTPAAVSPPLLGASKAELTAWAIAQGQPGYRGQQLHQWIYERGVRNLSDITVLPKGWRQDLTTVPVGRSQLHYRAEATDGTVKYLLQLGDGEIIETVGIPTEQRLTVCVSSQVGCSMACNFCATGKGGLRRSLACHEIVDQVLTVQEDFQRRVSHVVFMGMGEPLLNLESVLGAIRALNQDVGIGQRQITVSTVGIPGRIRRLAETGQLGDCPPGSGLANRSPGSGLANRPLQFTLAVSLHASNQQVRDSLIPSSRHYPLADLLAECRDYVRLTGRRLSFEYILLRDINDRPQHAEELSQLVRGFQSHVNLIPYNPISDADYQRPDPQRIEAFSQILRQRRVAVSVRYSRGLDADAACGQLRASRVSP